MSVLPEQHSIASTETIPAEDEALVFAAASILKDLAAGSAARPVREVTIGDQNYRLEGRRLHTANGPTGPIVLVHVREVASELPAVEEVRKRFGLTKKEACVAHLIAEDQTNEQIAAKLWISPHTARHHTERVLAKLGVKSRTKVRNALVSVSPIAESD